MFNMNGRYKGTFAGAEIHFRFRYDETVKYFNGWLDEDSSCYPDPVEVSQLDYDYQKKKWNVDENPYTESLLSVYRACDELLKHDRCVFHGAAFLWKGKAYLFTAQSGTGKSTQLFNWMDLYGEEIQIMNGDKPVLYYDGEKVMVYPSPWKGKEGLGDDSLIAPMGGIIILEQGKENRIKRLAPQQSVKHLIQRILFTVETKEAVYCASKMIEAIVSSVPVWKLINTGNKESSELTYETIGKELNP